MNAEDAERLVWEAVGYPEMKTLLDFAIDKKSVFSRAGKAKEGLFFLGRISCAVMATCDASLVGGYASEAEDWRYLLSVARFEAEKINTEIKKLPAGQTTDWTSSDFCIAGALAFEFSDNNGVEISRARTLFQTGLEIAKKDNDLDTIALLRGYLILAVASHDQGYIESAIEALIEAIRDARCAAALTPKTKTQVYRHLAIGSRNAAKESAHEADLGNQYHLAINI